MFPCYSSLSSLVEGALCGMSVCVCGLCVCVCSSACVSVWGVDVREKRRERQVSATMGLTSELMIFMSIEFALWP